MSQTVTLSTLRRWPCKLLPMIGLMIGTAGHATPSVFENPIAMTLTQAVSFPSQNHSKRLAVNVLPARPRTWLLEDRHDLTVRMNLQKDRTAPLVFIIPGTGGTASTPGALALAEKIFNQGYQTVTIDNAFSWTFAIAGSSATLPGYTPDDAVDLYVALQKVSDVLSKKFHVAPKNTSLVGYSLGALESVFLKKLDDQKKAFRFSKVVLINTPVDLLYALRGIDVLYERSAGLSPQRRHWIYGRVISAGEKYLGKGTAIDFSSPDFLNEAFHDLEFNDHDMVYLIGQTFRDSLRDVIFASQQVQDRGLLKKPISKYKRSARYAEAASFSYTDYLQKFLLPSVRERAGRNMSVQELNSRASLYQFEAYLLSQSDVFALHSEDDFLLKGGDVDWLKKAFGARLTLFPYGGHLGAMNFPQFAEKLKTLFPPAG